MDLVVRRAYLAITTELAPTEQCWFVDYGC